MGSWHHLPWWPQVIHGNISSTNFGSDQSVIKGTSLGEQSTFVVYEILFVVSSYEHSNGKFLSFT